MLQYNAQDAKQLEDLNKFARFITKKFGVQIVFESASAKADNENTIYLPSILGMTARDVAFLTRITLHEVGHIKYTNYKMTKEIEIKSENHFRLINAVEDARIENLLMQEYDGAHDMFESLYNDFSADHKYMQKVFGFDPMKCDMWYFLSIYLHDYLVKISPKKNLSKIYGKKNAGKLTKLVAKLKLESYLQNVKLITWKDAVEIATEVYNRFVKYLKDQSKKIDIDKSEDAKKEVQKALSATQQKIQKLINDIDEATKKLSEMQDEFEQAEDDRLKKLRQAENTRNAINTNISIMKRRLNDYKHSIKKHAAAMKAKSKVDKYEKELSELEQTLKDLNNQIAQTDAIKQSKALKKIDNLSKKVEKRQEQIEKQSNFYKERIEQADDRSSMTSAEANQMEKDVEKLEDDWKDAVKEVAKHRELSEIEKNYNKQLQKREQAQNSIHSELLNGLKNVQKKVTDANMPALEGMPGYESNEEWQDSDQAQQMFDEKASNSSDKIVVNGRQFSVGNGREILAMIDKSIDDVKDFNILEHFAENTTDDKLKNFNDINNTIVFEENTKTDYVSEKHIALTTQYDRTVYRETSNSVEIDKLKRKNANWIAAVKAIFKNKMRFNRRDRFKSNQEDGYLDTRAVWKIAAQVKDSDSRYFERITPKYINKNVASIVVDISGSNDKIYTGYGEKMREVATFISEGLNEVHVEHEILGVHAPISHEMREQHASSVYNRRSNLLETVVYKKFENKRNNGLQNIEIECADNSDGEHLRNVAKGLMKRGSNKVMSIFYITDGKPFLSDANLNILDSDLYRTINWLKANKIKLFVIGFNHEPKKFYRNDYCEVKDYTDLLKYFNTKL